jgi:hypothetical protein
MRSGTSLKGYAMNLEGGFRGYLFCSLLSEIASSQKASLAMTS